MNNTNNTHISYRRAEAAVDAIGRMYDARDAELACDGLSAAQVLARVPGLNYRRLHTWTASHHLKFHTHDPDGDTGPGIPYCGPPEEVAAAARMLRLIDLGFTLAAATDLAHDPEKLSHAAAALASEA
jgi:hypothetical protein